MADLLRETKQALRLWGLRAQKGLGQHFLVDGRVLRRTLEVAQLSPQDTVVEVGPGLGFLTQELAQRAGRVVAVEVDPRLASALTDRFSSLSNLTIVQADILQTQPAALLGPDFKGTYKLVANLPYYIASPTLRLFLEASLKPDLIVVMVQHEVGKEMVATPGQMGLFSISVQLYGHPTIVARVPSQSFYPPPKVDSALVRIEVYPRPAVEVPDVSLFFQVVKAGFSTPRKQLRNALANGLGIPPVQAQQLLEKAGVSPQRRAQTLSLPEWAALCQAWALPQNCHSSVARRGGRPKNPSPARAAYSETPTSPGKTLRLAQGDTRTAAFEAKPQAWDREKE